MAYRIEIRPEVRKEMRRFPKRERERIRAAIGKLADNPRPVGCIAVKDLPNAYRMRIGDYRVIWTVEDDLLLIVVIRATRRDEGTYRRLHLS